MPMINFLGVSRTRLTQRYPALDLAAPPTRRSLLVLRGFESVPVRAAQMPSRSAA